MDKITNGSHITTYSGLEYNILEPKLETVNIYDIAHALANSCRYNGHCNQFYSIAEHCVHVSYQVPEKDALAGLLHDASEAYVGDMVKPLKKFMNYFKEIEDKNVNIIYHRFGLEPKEPDSVKEADYKMLLTEQRQLFNKRNENIKHPVSAYEMKIHCWEPKFAEIAFLGRFFQLYKI